MNSIRTKSYHHIDNGGLDIRIETMEEGYTTLTFGTSYMGYPSISSSILLGSESIEILEMYRDVITKHIAKMKIKQ